MHIGGFEGVAVKGHLMRVIIEEKGHIPRTSAAQAVGHGVGGQVCAVAQLGQDTIQRRRIRPSRCGSISVVSRTVTETAVDSMDTFCAVPRMS